MKKNGFSLIELLVVITIIGILSAIGLTSYRIANQKARDSKRQADIVAIQSSLETFRTNNDRYPVEPLYTGTDAAGFAELFSNDRIPTDPNGANYVYARPNAFEYTLTYTLELDGPQTVDNP